MPHPNPVVRQRRPLRDFTIFTRLVNCCWSLFQWGLFLAVAAALVVGVYIYLRLDDEIRRQVEHRLAGHYRHLAVHVGGARFEKDRGITVYGLSVLEPQSASTPQPLLSIDELFLAGQIRMEDLVKGQPPIERIVVRRPRLRAILQKDGRWNVGALVPLPKFSDHCPVLSIEDATLILEQPSQRNGECLTMRGVDVTLTPVPADRRQAPPSRRYQVSGTVTGLPAKVLKIEGYLDPNDGSLDLTTTVGGLEVSPELLASVPGLPKDATQEAQISGRADIVFRATRAGGANRVLEWSASVKVDRGQLTHPLLPHPVTDLQLVLSAAPNRLTIEQLTGRCGTANVVLACERHGWNTTAPLGLAVKVVGLSLDKQFEESLPAAATRYWKRFRPAGLVDAEVRLAFDGERWRPRLIADCRGISLTDAEKFPYPLEQATGRVEYTPAGPDAPDQFRLNLTAMGAGRPVLIEAQLSQLTRGLTSNATSDPQSEIQNPQSIPPHPVGYVEISGADIPLHDQLLDAMKEKEQRLVRSLHAQGTFDFRWRAEWADATQPRATISQDITLKDCSIQFDKFRYPLRHVAGLVTARNRTWEFHNVVGRGGNDSTVVVCTGKSTPVGDGCQVDLLFQAQNVPLDDNLRQALTEPAQRAWAELRPQGRVDLAAHVVHETGQLVPAIAVTLRPCERSVSLEPQSFPYRFEQVEGTATFQDGRVELKDVVAHHDRATFSAASGVWQPTPGGGWQFVLGGFNSDSLTVHRDLLVALPPRLQKTLERLQPTGNFQLNNSTLSFTKNPSLDRIASAWDVNLVCHQAALQGGIPLDHIWGEVRMVGQDDGQTSYTTGELSIDSVVWKEMQFANVRGPLWVDRSLCLLGQPATQKQGQPPRRITADAYGGSMAGDARIEHDGNPRYHLEVALGGADLGRFANERLGGPKELTGTVTGKLTLTGAGRSSHSLNGSGELHVVDAQIYELPLMVALLKALPSAVFRNRTPNNTAFDRVDMNFAIQGEHVHFQQLNLLGDAVSLYGRGQTNLDRELDLVFYSLVGPAVPIWKTIAGQVSQQGLQLKVTGTWEKPETEKDVLPSVNQVLKEIQNGIQAGAATITPPAASRSADLPTRR